MKYFPKRIVKINTWKRDTECSGTAVRELHETMNYCLIFLLPVDFLCLKTFVYWEIKVCTRKYKTE